MKQGDLVRRLRHPETNSIGVVVDTAWDGTPVIFYGVPDKEWGPTGPADGTDGHNIWELEEDVELIYESR